MQRVNRLKLVKRPDDRREESATWLEGEAIESREKGRIKWFFNTKEQSQRELEIFK